MFSLVGPLSFSLVVSSLVYVFVLSSRLRCTLQSLIRLGYGYGYQPYGGEPLHVLWGGGGRKKTYLKCFDGLIILFDFRLRNDDGPPGPRPAR